MRSPAMRRPSIARSPTRKTADQCWPAEYILHENIKSSAFPPSVQVQVSLLFAAAGDSFTPSLEPPLMPGRALRSRLVLVTGLAPAEELVSAVRGSDLTPGILCELGPAAASNGEAVVSACSGAAAADFRRAILRAGFAFARVSSFSVVVGEASAAPGALPVPLGLGSALTGEATALVLSLLPWIDSAISPLSKASLRAGFAAGMATAASMSGRGDFAAGGSVAPFAGAALFFFEVRVSAVALPAPAFFALTALFLAAGCLLPGASAIAIAAVNALGSAGAASVGAFTASAVLRAARPASALPPSPMAFATLRRCSE